MPQQSVRQQPISPRQSLCAAIERELATVVGIVPGHIYIAEADGAVTLTGAVKDMRTAEAVARAVFRVPGVKTLACELTIDRPTT